MTAVQSLSTAPESFLNSLSRRIPAGNPMGPDRLPSHLHTSDTTAGTRREITTANLNKSRDNLATAGRIIRTQRQAALPSEV